MRPQSAAGTQEKVSSSELGLSVPPLPTASSGVKISPRPATAGLATSRSGASSSSPRQARQSIQPVDTAPHRDARSYFDGFKKEEQRELIAQSTASWLLSPDFRGQAGVPCGLISNLCLSQKQHLTLLFPKVKNVPDVEYREIHQIVRELTSGIFGVNQMPLLRIEPNFDLSSTCHLPVAYQNTKVGQVLTSVDYAMKSLWHGACVARSTRTKLTERWRGLLNVNPATGEFNASSKNAFSEFSLAGQEFVSQNEIYLNLYEELNNVDPSAFASTKENQFFNSYADFVRCVMAFSVSKVQANSEENVIAFDSVYDVSSAITLPDDDFIAPTQLQRLRRRLRHHLKMIRKGLLLDPHVQRNIVLLKFISAVSLILVALRRRLMRVPDIDNMLPQIQADLLRTEAELPPFAIGKQGDHPCETFAVNSEGKRRVITHCHGEIQFDVDTLDVESLTDGEWCRNVQVNAIDYLTSLMEKPRPEYPVQTATLDGKDLYVVHIPLTTYYPAAPPQPGWLHARYQMLGSLRPKRLLMSDLQLSELFKQTFGFKKAIANKTIEGGLKLSACRGLVAPFVALMRKTASSTLLSPDLQGLTLLHYACIYNRPGILSILLSQKPNLSIRRSEIKAKSTRATALVYAARCGALQCVNALLASRANPVLSDQQGKSAIHHASAADQTSVLRCLLRRHPNLLETPVTGEDNSTPLLVAASSGALLALKFLIRQGACVTACDVLGDGVIQRAALNFHADIIEYFIHGLSDISTKAKFEKLNIWSTMVELLKSSSVIRQDAALRCLEVLLHRESDYWKPFYEAGAVFPLVNLLQSNKRRPRSASQDGTGHFDDLPSSPIRSLACSVVCLMSEQDCVRRAVANAGAIPTLISLLKPAHLTPRAKHIRYEIDETQDERFELQSRSSVVLSDLAHVDAANIAEHGGIAPLVDLLQLNVVDVLVNAVMTLAALCRGDKSGAGDIQGRIMECGAADSLVEFLSAKDDALQTATADAIAAICDKNETIQNEFVSIGVLKPLVGILRGHCIGAQLKAALAVDSIAKNNFESQKRAAFEGAPDALCRLFQIWDDTVKERGACALWSLAGEHPEQQRAVANRIGTKQIIEMMISKSELLQLIGCQAVAAISRKSFSGQEQLIKNGTIPPLIRLLRLSRTTRKVTIATLDAITSMCTSVAHLNNNNAQELIAEEGAIELLLDRVWLTARDELMQVDLLLCLASVVTGCSKNELKLAEIDTFGYEIPLELFNSADIIVKFRAALALAIFSFNRLPQQQKILKLGGIPYPMLEVLLEFHDPIIRAGAAFQLVVLARVVSDVSVVDASARGIIVLLEMLEHGVDEVVVASENYLTSLAHTRAGVPEAIVSAGAVQKLLHHLQSDNDLVRIGAAQALGYLSFNRTASRELMSTCRGTVGIYESLLENLGQDGKISKEFLAEFKRQATVGLPIPEKLPSRKTVSSKRPETAFADGKNQRKLAKPNGRPRSVSPLRCVLVTENVTN